jgi:hypothetical protein
MPNQAMKLKNISFPLGPNHLDEFQNLSNKRDHMMQLTQLILKSG